MNQLPSWMQQGFRRNGPRRLVCRCGAVVSSNALGRAAHLRGEAHAAWEERRALAEALRRRVRSAP